jgi:uncharacterized membrane protein
MSLDLALIRFPGETKAAHLLEVIRAHEVSHAAWTNEVALVEHHRDGRISVRVTFAGRDVDGDDADHVSESGALEGALTGGLVAAIFGRRGFAAGLVLEGAVEPEPSRLAQVESAAGSLVDALHSSVPKGVSALVLLAAPMHVDALLSALGGVAGAVFRRTLTAEQATALTTALNGSKIASAGLVD